MRPLILALCSVCFSVGASADTLKDKVDKELKELKARTYRLVELQSPTITDVIKQELISVRFMQWPISFPAPAGYAAVTLVYEDAKGNLVRVRNDAELETLFRNQVRPANEASLRAVARAWLTLAAELRQDGYFSFVLDESSIKVNIGDQTNTVSGTIGVKPVHGDRGAVSATLRFRYNGLLVGTTTKSTLRAGVRPICQAKKLLDSDPIVRRMAERDLQVLGLDAKPYLDWIRPQLSAAQQKAADALWQRIVADER